MKWYYFDEINIIGHKTRDLRYVDNTAHLSTTTEGLGKLMQATKEHSQNKRSNIKNTQIIDTAKCENKTNAQINHDTPIPVNGKTIQVPEPWTL